MLDDDDEFEDDDIFAADFKKNGRGDDDYVEDNDDSDSDDIVVKPARAATRRKGKLDPSDSDDEMKDVAPEANQAKKRKSDAVLDRDEEEKPSQRSKPASKKQKASPKKKEQTESREIQEIYDSIPTVRPPTPPPMDSEKRKFNFGAQRSRTPPAAGTKEIPVGAENCLAGLSFVFTGVLDTLGREEGQNLVKRYGGKVTSAPSSKTSYVVLGHDAGPKKLETIRAKGIKTINEDGLFELIRRLPANGGNSKAASQYEAKRKAEEAKVRAMAAEMEQEEKRRKEEQEKAARTSGSAQGAQQPAASQQASKTDDRLWTTKYAPTSLNMLCGNKTQVEKLQTWLRNWRRNAKANFKLPGKDGSGLYRAVMIHGPPGIGKTTAAHLIARLEGYDVVETNASDTRNKKLLEEGLTGVLDTTSLQGYFTGAGKRVEPEKKKLVLIMDEVDGMSAGDRGGVGALASVAKKTQIPLILICNDRRLPKMKPFDHIVYELPFRRPTPDQIRARLTTICYREGLKIPPPVLDSLIEGTGSDIRQVINMLSTVKLDQNTLDFDKGKEMSKAWEKHIILKPWDIVGQILSAQMFSPSSKSTLNDKIELYFNDHEFSYLMLQENYLRTNPSRASGYSGRERTLKLLELADNAASSISDGDLVDRMIHGSQQHWSLMPTHAAFSFVRPASFMSGNMTERPAFTSWLGQNSKQGTFLHVHYRSKLTHANPIVGKLGRYVKEIQGHMRLRTPADRDEIRQQYLPVLWTKLVQRLMDEGKEAVDEVIDLMDSYFLTRDDWDAMVELGLGPMNESRVKLDTATKATFTRLYNQRSHPLPFMKASNVVAPKKAGKVKPDLEDVIDESDEDEILGEESKEEEVEGEELDLKKDKYVKMPKKATAGKNGGGKANSKGKGKGKKKANKGKSADDEEEDDDHFIDDDEDEPPQKGWKGKGKARAK